MTTETTATDKALATQGATVENLDAGATGTEGAPKAPAAPVNTPPKVEKKEGLGEENGVDVPVVETDPAKVAAAKVVADKAVADKVEADKEAAGPLKSYTAFPESPAAAAAVELLKEAGVGPNAANEFFAKAIKSGNLADVDVAGLEAKLGKAKATLVMAGVKTHYEGLAAHSASVVTQTHEIFGGEANWNTVRDWAKASEKTDPALKNQIDGVRSLLDEGGPRAAAGARELLRLYNAAPQTKGLGTNKLAVGETSGSVIGTHLTRADYIAELKTANDRGAKPSEINAINARRRAGMKAGI